MKFLVESLFIVNENSQRNIEQILGYPKEVAKILQDSFGKNSFIISKWFKEYSNRREVASKNWFSQNFSRPSIRMGRDSLSTSEYVDFIKSTENKKDYESFLKKKGFYVDPEEVEILFSIPGELEDLRHHLSEELKESLFSDIFFYNTFIKSILNGEVENINDYKNLTFEDAVNKFRSSKVFDEKSIIKQYENGYTWRDVGAKCELIGSSMKNCGSTGVMSSDPEKTMLVLFDDNNKTHAIVTYSPNQKRISGVEGQASNPLKDKYHNYVLDLKNHLGVEFDYGNDKSRILQLRAKLEDIADSIYVIYDGPRNSYASFLINGEKYFTNTHKVVGEKDFLDFKKYKSENVKENLSDKELMDELFDYYYQSPVPVKINIYDFIKNIKSSQDIKISESFFIESFFI